MSLLKLLSVSAVFAAILLSARYGNAVTVHDNDVYLGVNYGDAQLVSGKYTLTGAQMYSGQDPNHQIVAGVVKTFGADGKMTFSVGRHGDSATADWFKGQIESYQNTFNHEPGDLNFAMIGDLELTLTGGPLGSSNETFYFRDIALAQGHAGTSNNWWFGGKTCNHSVNYTVSCRGTSSVDTQISMIFVRGGSADIVVDNFTQGLEAALELTTGLPDFLKNLFGPSGRPPKTELRRLQSGGFAEIGANVKGVTGVNIVSAILFETVTYPTTATLKPDYEKQTTECLVQGNENGALKPVASNRCPPYMYYVDRTGEAKGSNSDKTIKNYGPALFNSMLLSFGSDGLVYTESQELFDTKSADLVSTNGGPSGNRPNQAAAIFVMDGLGNLYASRQHSETYFFHSSIFAGEPVAAAGYIYAEKGVIKALSSCAYQYEITEDQLDNVIESLAGRNPPLNGLEDIILVSTCSDAS